MAKVLRSLLPALLVLLLSLGATTTAALLIGRSSYEGARRQFQAEAVALRETIREVLTSYVNVLHSSAGLANAVPELTRDTWRTFISNLNIAKSYPGLQGLGYVSVLHGAEAATHIAEQRRLGRPTYDIRPAGSRDTLAPVVFLEPEDWRNQRAIGWDMMSESVRQAAMQRARDAGSPVLSGRVTLVQETSENPQPGMLLYFPLYRGGEIPSSLEERRRRLRGFVYAPMRMHDFFERSLASELPRAMPRLHFEVFDGTSVDPQRLVFDSAEQTGTNTGKNAPAASPGKPTSPTFSTIERLDEAGSSWTLRIASQAAFEASIDWTKAWIVLAGGTVISLLISAIATSLAYARDRLAISERTLSAEVRERQKAQEEVLLANGELIHRVKNTLGIVSAIASQTARYSTSLAEFDKAFRERLGALGRVHDLLRPDPAFTPELHAFLLDLLAPYSARSPTALKLQGPQVSISRNEAVLLSLVFNELATNATKYGAWTKPDGSIACTWSIVDQPLDTFVETTRRHIDLTWKESGGPAVDVPTRKGFGSNVMKFAIERSLRGQFVTKHEPDGIRCDIKLPLSGDAEVQAQAPAA